MNKKVIIFDFDGVIVDSPSFSYEINRKQYPNLSYNEWQSWFDGNVYDNIRKEIKDDDPDSVNFLRNTRKNSI